MLWNSGGSSHSLLLRYDALLVTSHWHSETSACLDPLAIASERSATMSPARRVFASPISPDETGTPPASFSRRQMMSGALTAGAGAALSTLPTAAQEATPGNNSASSTIETEG